MHPLPVSGNIGRKGAWEVSVVIALLLICIAIVFNIGGAAIIKYAWTAKTNSGMDTGVTLIILGCLFLYLAIRVLSAKRRRKRYQDTSPFVNPYVDVSMYEAGIVPIVNYHGLLLKPNEVLIYATPGYTFADKEKVVGYTGGSSGYSVRVAKGFTVRQGSSKGRAIRQDVREFNKGDYIVTSQRLVFLGEKQSFDQSYSKITGMQPIARDSFRITAGSKIININVPANQAPYALGLARSAMQTALQQ